MPPSKLNLKPNMTKDKSIKEKKQRSIKKIIKENELTR